MLPHSPMSSIHDTARSIPDNSWGTPILRFFLVLLFSLVFATSSYAVVYVDKDKPGGNGTSWAEAYKTLEAAINATHYATDFWIAEGTYTPSATLLLGSNQNHSYYGGFAGTETAVNQRNVSTHPTIVDGQGILKHVFYATSWVTNVRFDGLTIKRGNANAASGEHASGGGIIVNAGAVVIANCTFLDNSATHLGGAVYLVNNPSVLITNSTFKNNTVTTIAGGGAGVAITKINDGTSPLATVEKSTFQGNSGGGVGGGLYSLYFPMTVKESRFIANSSANGGAIMYDYKLAGAAKIERCLFTGNTATERGGAICSYARSVDIENSVFAYNSTPVGGGAVGLHSGLGIPSDYNSSYSGVFSNCTFYGNAAGTTGGGIQNIGGHPMYIYNSAFWSNTGITYWQDAAARASNDVGNLNSSIGVQPITMRYTNMETLGWPNGPANVNQVGSFAANPLFVDPNGADNVQGTGDDNLSISSTSPCTDRADGNYAPNTDIVLRGRTDNPGVVNLGTGSPNYADIGAYEGPYSYPTSTPQPSGNVSMPPVLHLLLNSVIFQEDFEGTWPRPKWTITDHMGTGLVWQRNDMVGSGNLCLYGSGFSATADSDKLDSSGVGMVTSLVSPPINLFTPQAYLGYASNFQVFGASGLMWLQISTNDGLNWTTLRFQDVDDLLGSTGPVPGGTWEVEDLTPYVGNTILLRWLYSDETAWAWYWQIDNVIISKDPPSAP